MGVIDKLKSVVGDSEPPAVDTPLKCADCGNKFEAKVSKPQEAECPECDGTRINTRLG